MRYPISWGVAKSWGQIKLGPNKVGVSKKLGSQKSWGPKRVGIPKKLGSQKVGVLKKLGAPKSWVSYPIWAQS